MKRATWAALLAAPLLAVLPAACSGDGGAAGASTTGTAATDTATTGEHAVTPAAPTPTELKSPNAWFTDVTADWNVDFVHDPGTTLEKHLPETMGGGVVVFDVEGDGDLDLYFVQSGSVPIPVTAPRATSEPGNALLFNDGSGRFENAGATSGAGAHRGYGQGAAAGDVDGNGTLDLYLAALGPDTLLSGDGRGAFREATNASGLGDERWTAGCLFFDADVDGDLDLYVTAYVAIDVEHPAWCGRREPGWRSYCHPDHYAGLPDRFWRNAGDGTFVDATLAAGLADNAGKGLGAIASDFDADGDPDLYVANDSVENRFWRNTGSGSFEDDTLLTGTGVNGRGATEAGMGLASGDVDGDLDLDLFVTNFDEESNTLYRNGDGGLFDDVTAGAGLDASSRLPVGFGAVLEDFDGDGDLDLAVANGHIIDNIELYHDGKSHAQPAHLYVNAGGVFAHDPLRAGDLAAEPFVGRGLVTGDLDGDGDGDLVLAQCGGPARVWRNDASVGSWLIVRGLPRGTRVVAVRESGAQFLREAGPQPTYYGQTEGAVRLAVAMDDPYVALELTRPGGESETWNELPGGAAQLVPVAAGGFAVQND